MLKKKRKSDRQQRLQRDDGKMINSFKKKKVQTSKEISNALKTTPKQSKWLQAGGSTLYLLSIGTDALDKIRLRLTQSLH